MNNKMKRVYFVRHAESEGNIGPEWPAPDSPLSKNGIRQSQKLADALSSTGFDLILSSPWARALETAGYVSQERNKEIIVSDLFTGRIRPSDQVGGLKAVEAQIQSRKEDNRAFAAGEKYKDGESFEEITRRAQSVLDLLADSSEERMVVVSHSTFMRVVFAVTLLQDRLTPESCWEIKKTLKTPLASISVFEFDPDKNRWRVRTWCSCAHLL